MSRLSRIQFYMRRDRKVSRMRISYDSEVDALYIRLIEGDHECRTIGLSDEVALNIGAGERLVGIEVLDAKEVIGNGDLPQIVVDNLSVQAA